MEAVVQALPGVAFSLGAFAAASLSRRRRCTRAEGESSSSLPLLQPWEVVTERDLRLVEVARGLLHSAERPIHSNFLVAAVVSYVDTEGAQHYVTGVNSETCVLPSAICAERCALVQLRLKRSFSHIDAVYITSTTTGADLITPGVLCREMLQEYGPPESTRVFLFSGDWLPEREPFCAERHSSRLDARGSHRVWRLSDLYPFPPLYHRVRRDDLVAVGKVFSERRERFAPPVLDVRGVLLPKGSALGSDVAESAPGDAGCAKLERAVIALYEEVTALAGAVTPADQLYPIHFAAGVLFSDGSVAVARQDKGLEYGCTLDAALKLAPRCGCCASSPSARLAGPSGDKAGPAGSAVVPVVMLHCDQFGNLSALHAGARSWFYEHGFGAVSLFAHEGGSGRLLRTTLERLSPAVPRISLT